MRLAVITDQISRDVDTACEQVTSWGGRDLELRLVGEGPVGHNLSPQFLEPLCATLERWDVRISGIAPQAFKLALNDPALRYHRRILLPASLHLAVLLKAPVVHIGAPRRPAGAQGPCPEAALEVLAEAAELAGNLGLILGLENEPGSWAQTGAEVAAIVKAVGHHALQITWDPAAALVAGESPFPTALQAVRPKLVSVRARDVQRMGAGYTGTLPGDGQAEIAKIISALAADGFSGTLALDSQLSPRLEGSRAAYETIQKMMSAAARAARR